MDTTAATFSDT